MPWRPVRPPSRRCEKKSSGLQDVQRSIRVDVLDAGRVQRPLGGAPEVEPAVADDLLAEPRAEGRARPPRRPRSSTARSPGRSRPRAGRRRARATAVCDDPGEQAAPADVQGGDRRRVAVRARDRDREAVGGEHQQRLPAVVGPEPVARLALARARAGRPRRAPAGRSTGAPASVPTSAQSRARFSATCSGRRRSACRG